MARLTRVVVPGIPHHITQRGNGGARTFFNDDDYAFYRDLLGERCRAAGVEVWAWVLMPNHVHMILVPHDTDGLRDALSKVHRRHAGRIHARQKETGHFWQSRFGAVAMDEVHLAAAARYVALNPERARLVARAQDWRWSSVHVHLNGGSDGVTTPGPLRDRFPRFAELLDNGALDARHTQLRQAESISRPLGAASFVAAIEAYTGRLLHRRTPGPKPDAMRNAAGGAISEPSA